jgi:hypothetical protein
MWHIFVFYLLENILNNEYENSPFYICKSNPITNIYYICTNNLFSSYFTKYIPGNILRANIIDPYTYICPIKVKYSDMIFNKN